MGRTLHLSLRGLMLLPRAQDGSRAVPLLRLGERGPQGIGFHELIEKVLVRRRGFADRFFLLRRPLAGRVPKQERVGVEIIGPVHLPLPPTRRSRA